MGKYANFIWYSKDTLMSLRVTEDGEYELVFTLTSDDESSFWFSKYLSSKEAKKLAKAIIESEE